MKTNKKLSPETMQKLYFPMAEVKRLIEVARQESPNRIATALQAFDEEGNEIENLVVPAALNWRIDYGVFLYPNNIDGAEVAEINENNLFAIGWHREKDNVWDREQELLKGRFWEHPISLEWIERVVGREREGFLVILVLPDDGFGLEWCERIRE